MFVGESGMFFMHDFLKNVLYLQNLFLPLYHTAPSQDPICTYISCVRKFRKLVNECTDIKTDIKSY